MDRLKPLYLFPLVLIGLVAGVAGGWIRLGATWLPIAGAASAHGVLMVGGFLGTLITLERSMVMKNKVWFSVPFVSGLSIPALLLGWATTGGIALLLASLGLVGIMYLQSLRHPVVHQFVMSIGAACWLLGNVVYLDTGFVAAAVPWWMGFLLMTIVGERLELSKFLPIPKWSKRLLLIFLAVFSVGISMPFHGGGSLASGAGLVLVALWLLYFDMAKVAARKARQFRYIGVGLRVGYVWLLANGLVLTLMGSHRLYYDLFLHTFFLGFVFSMIWAHAPIILPMVLGIKQTPYHPVLWLGWGLFQLTLVGRVVASVLGFSEWRTHFGVANGWLILAMFGLMAAITGWNAYREKRRAGLLEASASQAKIDGFKRLSERQC